MPFSFPNPRRYVAAYLPLAVALLLFLASCGERATPTPLPPLQPAMTAAAAPVASETTVANPGDPLIVWLPAFTGLAAEGSAGSILTNAFHQFEQRNPNIALDVQVKADVGTASLFNFLRSAQDVAPSILPDLVLINTQQLWQIVDLGLVVGISEAEWRENGTFFAVANAAATYRAQRVGIPYIVDVTHLAYDADEITIVPNTWADLMMLDQNYLFPAAEAGTTYSTLLHYVGAGGELLEDGAVSDPVALERFFAFITEAHEQEIIPTAVLDIQNFNSSWRAFSEDQSNLVAVQVAQFYPNTTGIKPPSYAPLPTRSGDRVTIAETWAFAILTEDPQRRQHAFTLISELLNPEVQGPWSQSVARLPSQVASLDLWTQSADYRDFVVALLDEAVAPPSGPAFADFARRLHAAQASILRGELTVEGAIESMVVLE